MKYLVALFIVAVLLFAALLVYYAPVVDRFINFCEYYPELTQDCRELNKGEL